MWRLCAVLFSISSAFATLGFASRSLADEVKLFTWSRGNNRGVLENLTVGSGPDSPIDPSLPTVVVTHGLNPLAPWFRCEVANRYAEAIGDRHGRAVNVLGWDWNNATVPSLLPSVNNAEAVRQGTSLGQALLRLGINPDRTHLIGQSSGAIVVASAARFLANATGRPVGRLTLLDPIGNQHPLIFDRLGAVEAARIVENLWASSPSGVGREVQHPGVINQAVPPSTGLLGLVRPFRSDHFNAVRWHLQRVAP